MCLPGIEHRGRRLQGRFQHLNTLISVAEALVESGGEIIEALRHLVENQFDVGIHDTVTVLPPGEMC